MVINIEYNAGDNEFIDAYDIQRQVENGIPTVSFSASFNQSLYNAQNRLIDKFYFDGSIYKVDSVSGSYEDLKVTGKDLAGYILSKAHYQRNQYANGYNALRAGGFKFVEGGTQVFSSSGNSLLDSITAKVDYVVVSNQGMANAFVNSYDVEHATLINTDHVDYKTLVPYIGVAKNQTAWRSAVYNGKIYTKKAGQLYATLDGSQPDTSFLASEITLLDSTLSTQTGLTNYWYIEQLKQYDQIFSGVKLRIIDRDSKKNVGNRSPVSFIYNGKEYISNNYKYDESDVIELL